MSAVLGGRRPPLQQIRTQPERRREEHDFGENVRDWPYAGGKAKATSVSRRAETYNSILTGTTKLRDGSVFLDPTAADFKRWRQGRKGPAPPYSIDLPFDPRRLLECL